MIGIDSFPSVPDLNIQVLITAWVSFIFDPDQDPFLEQGPDLARILPIVKKK